MARIVPAYMDERSPPGEKYVFEMLLGGPVEWTAIHSLDLAPWNRNLRTELDFLLMVPGTGILCIEVKSHKNIFFDGTMWLPDSLDRNPFKQALDARGAFVRRIIKIMPVLQSVPITQMCIFPFSSFDPSNTISICPWEVIDQNSCPQLLSSIELFKNVEVPITDAIKNDPQHTKRNGSVQTENVM